MHHGEGSCLERLSLWPALAASGARGADDAGGNSLRASSALRLGCFWEREFAGRGLDVWGTRRTRVETLAKVSRVSGAAMASCRLVFVFHEERATKICCDLSGSVLTWTGYRGRKSSQDVRRMVSFTL